MTPLRTLTALACLLAACGDGGGAKVRSADGRYAVVRADDDAAVTAALRRNPGATLVVALGIAPVAPPPLGASPPKVDPLARAVDAAGRAQRPFVVTVGGSPHAGAPDAAIVTTSGADVAVDLALLACSGVAPTTARIELGAKVVTPANRAAGGEPVAAPGDFFVAMMRAEHRALLTTEPAADVSHRIGVLTSSADDPWQLRAAADARAAIARYPQLELIQAPADGDLAARAGALRERGCRALLLATSDPADTAAVEAAAARGDGDPCAVFVLDPLVGEGHGAASIGVGQAALGRAAAAQVRRLLPEGGELIVCPAPADAPGAAARLDAFCETLGLDATALRDG